MLNIKKNYSKAGYNSYKIFKILEESEYILKKTKLNKIDNIQKKFENFKKKNNNNAKSLNIKAVNNFKKPAFGIQQGREIKKNSLFINKSNRNYKLKYDLIFPKVKNVIFSKSSNSNTLKSIDNINLENNLISKNIKNNNNSIVNMEKMFGRSKYNSFKENKIQFHDYNLQNKIQVPNFNNYLKRNKNIEKSKFNQIYEPNYNSVFKKITKDINFNSYFFDNNHKNEEIKSEINPIIKNKGKIIPKFNKMYGRESLKIINR